MKDNMSLLNWPQPMAMIPDSLEFSQVYGYLWVGLGLERDKKQQRKTEQKEAFMIDDVLLSNC